jgi:uncharacterized protein (TIGR02594 family)
MAKRDVEFTVRARNEASRALAQVDASLQDLKTSQDQVQVSSGKTATFLDRLGAEAKSLASEVKGLETLGKVAGIIEKAGTVAAGLAAKLQETKQRAAEGETGFKSTAAAIASLAEQGKLTAAALDAQKKATAAAKSEQDGYRAKINAAQDALDRLAKALFNAEKPSEALRAKYVAQAKALADLQVRQRAAVAEYQRQSRAQNALADSDRSVVQALAEAERQQRQFAGELKRTESALSRQSAELEQVEANLLAMRSAADIAGKALGGVAIDQKTLETAARNAAEGLERVQATLSRERARPAAATPSTPAASAAAAYREQVRAVTEAKTALDAARVEAARLGAELARTAEPTAELQQQFRLARLAVEEAKVSFAATGQALVDLRNKGQSGFAVFEQKVAGIRSAATATEQVRSAIANSTTVWGRFAGILSTVVAEFRRVPAAAQAAASATQTSNRMVQNGVDLQRTALSLTQRYRAEFLSIIAGFSGLYTAVNQIRGLTDTIRSVEAAESRLGVVFDQDAKKIAEAMQFLRAEGARLGLSFTVLAKQYGTLGIAAKGAGFSIDETRQLFVSIAEAARVNAVSTEELEGIYRAFSQMLSKGKVNAEELRGQLGDRMTGAFRLFADAIGVTTMQLDAMLQRGEVFADRQTLLKVAKRLDEVYGAQLPKALELTVTSLDRIGNAAQEARLQVAEGGFEAALKRMADAMLNLFSSTEGKQFLQSLGAALGVFLDVITFVITDIDRLGVAIQALIAFGVVKSFSQWARAATTTAERIAALRVAADATGRPIERMLSASLLGRFAAYQTAMTGLRASVVALGTNFTVANARTAAWSAGMVLARGVTLTLTTAVRGLYVALGGLPGILIGLVTFFAADLFGDWIAGADDATSALDRHKTMVGEVRDAYQKAKGDAKKWAEEIKTVSSIQVQVNTIGLQRELQDQIDAVEEAQRQLRAANLQFNLDDTIELKNQPVLDEIYRLSEALKAGEISAVDFKKRVNELAEANPQLDKTLIAPMLDAADKAIELSDAISENNDVLKIIKGEAGDVKRSFGELEGGVENLNNAFDPARIESYSKALGDLAKMVPGLAEASKRAGELAEAKRLRDQAVANASPFNPFQKFHAESVYRQAVARINANAAFGAVSGAQGERVLATASGFAGRTENADGNLLSQFFKAANVNIDPETTKWCAAFVNAVLATNGLPHSSKLNARSFLDYGSEVAPDKVQPGDIVVIKGKGTTDGHVGFFQNFNQDGSVQVLGGNQSKKGTTGAVTSSTFGADQVLSFRRPPGEAETFAEAAKNADESAKKIAEATAAYDRWIEDGKADVAIQQAKAANNEALVRQLTIEQAVRQKIEDLKKSGLPVDAAIVARVNQQVAQQYDLANAQRIRQEEQQRTEKAVNDLMERRQLLQEQIKNAQENGESARVIDLKTQLSGVNAELDSAIVKAIQMWQAIGGAESENAILRLSEMGREIQRAKSDALDLGIAGTHSLHDIKNSLQGGLMNAWDSFWQRIDDGENAFKAAGQAFLQFAADFLREIARMIVQQLIFNLVSSLFGGGGLGGQAPTAGNSQFGAGVHHKGGIAGKPKTTRMISPAAFANAMRFHNGGLPGLGRDEVATILKKGEEVVTEDNPRHVANAGGKTGLTVNNYLDAAEFFSKGADTPAGERVLMNFIRARRGQIKAELG